ncbi:MAG: uroporphyrinogen-III synthase [Bacteroidota bacterium]
MSLQGKTVLITRAAESDDSFGRLLEARGATILHLPTIKIVDPDSWDDCDRAIITLREYDGVFFTSKNGVLKFLQRIEAVNAPAKSVLSNRPVYAVGEKTEEALENAGFPVTMTPEVFSGEDLAALFSREEVQGKRLLFPRSNIGKEILPKALRSLGAVVDEVTAYKTVSPEKTDLDGVRHALVIGKVDIVTFFSPSAVRNFLQMMGSKCLEHTLVAVIGPTTAAAATGLGIEVRIVSKQSTAESLVETLAEQIGETHDQ